MRDDEDNDREDYDTYHVRGTATCNGLCDPQCDWCLVGHDCPEACGGGEACPYESLAMEEELRVWGPEGMPPAPEPPAEEGEVPF